ncbi:hypothetical protein M2284_001986 [Rhodococcus sp. LBL1]|nr:hypothetical protein [Rhodococcus sp. LBL1]MDH6683374.1 hypothetical protein [Rhodococcus sp. LBL2]
MSQPASGARDAVHDLICRYMELCDVPSVGFSVDALAALFTEDAVWEGVGADYAARFGTRSGRDAVIEMVASHLPPNDHFRRNVHLLGNEQIDVDTDGGAARGRWIMQQLSTYRDGTSELIAARIDAEVDLTGAAALIRRFRTERLFATPLPAR